MNNSVKHQLTHPKYRADIDGLRAIAVLLVVFYHAFPSIVKGGFIGVDIFFIISGFLISTIILKSLNSHNFSFIDFYSRRVNRIFPTLIVVLLSSLIFSWFILLPTEYSQLAKHVLGGAGFISNFLLWSESGYFDSAAEAKPLLHLWSLGIEEQFYILWPLLLSFGYKLKNKVFYIILLVGLGSFLINILTSYSDPVADFYSPLTRFWELVIGAFLAYLKLNLEKSNRLSNSIFFSSFLSMIGISLIFLSVFTIDKDSKFPGWFALLPTIGSFLVILAGPTAVLNKYILSNKRLVWIGLISFPLYLWHWPIFSFAQITQGGVPSFEVRGGLVLLSFILAWLTYEFIEKPIRFRSSRLLVSKYLIFGMFLVSFSALLIFFKDGFPSRFSPLIQELLEYSIDNPTKTWRVGECHLLPNQGYDSFGACESESKKANKPTIMIWGDSHGAHLYSGIAKHFGDNYRIIQMTASTCPPIIDMEISVSPNCLNINSKVIEFIRKEKPDRVALTAAWDVYDWKRLDVTVKELKGMGIKNIDLIGAVPRWLDNLSRQLLVYFKKSKNSELPNRMKFGLSPNVYQLDKDMSVFADENNINYQSPTKILCNDIGCLTRTGNDGGSLTAFDNSHLTEVGADYVVSHFRLWKKDNDDKN